MPGLCRGDGGAFPRQCVAGLASGNEGGPGADVEAVSREKLGRRFSGVHVCGDACLLRRGGIQQGAPGCGEHLCDSMDATLWGHADSSGKVDMYSFFLQWN